MTDDVVDLDIPEEQDQPSGRPSASRTLARLALEQALGPDLTRWLGAADGPPVAIVVQAPGVDWVEPLRRAVGRLASRCQMFARSVTPRAADRADGNDEVAAALFLGRHCVGVSHAPERLLPSSLLTLADARVEVRAPGADLIRRLLATCVGRPPRAIPEPAAAGLGFHDIAGCFRQGATPSQVLAYLAAASSSRTRVAPTDDTPTLQNLAGYGEARTWGLELADGLAAWRRGEIRWADLPATSAVLHGPPGCGKTLFARSLARTLEVPIVVTSIGGLFASTTGYLATVIKGLQSAFDEARANTPSILFLDELDALPDRNSLDGHNGAYFSVLVNFALTLLDSGSTPRDGIIVIGASNFRDRLDAALIRPGRFDRLIEIPPPDPVGLAGILRSHLRDALPGADLEFVARLRPGASGALAAQWAREARAAARAAGRAMVIDDLVAVVAPPDPRTPDDVWRGCVHEAGHAVMHVVVGRELDSVTTVRDGQHGGSTVGASGSPSPTAEQLNETVRILLGGRASEALLLGFPSAGAQGDIARATAIIGALHASQGLGGSLLYRSAPEDILPLLTYDAALRRTVEDHVDRLYAETLAAIRRRAAAVERLARALQTRRALTGAEARAIVAGRRRAPGSGRAAP